MKHYIGNIQISILPLCFLHPYVEFMITMCECINSKDEDHFHILCVFCSL